MTFQERVGSVYPVHSQLTSTLSVTSNASSEVRDTLQYIAELQSIIKLATKDIKPLQTKVWRLRSNYEGLRDGSTKRLFSKVSGKTEELVSKTSKAEQEYQDALEEQVKVNQNLETSKRNLEEAQRSLVHLKDQAAIHTATESELDDLYSSVFSLPHADYPPEKSANQEIASLQVPISELQKQIDCEAQTLKLLTNANKSLMWCHAAIQNAENADISKGGPFSDYHNICLNIVRNAMGTAQLHAMQADSAYNAAQQVQPSIQDMRQLKILDEGYLLGGSYKAGSNLLLEATGLTTKIFKCGAEMKLVIEEVEWEMRVAKERMQRLGAERDELEEEAMDVLRNARMEVVEMVMGRREEAREEGDAGTDDEEAPSVGPPGYTPWGV